MKHIIAFYRFSCVILVTFTWAVIAVTILPFVPCKYIPYAARIWGRMTVAAAGVKIQLIGTFNPFIERNRMVVSNHISWLDVPILQSVYAMSFVGKTEMKKWPLIGSMAKRGGTIFIDRKNKRELVKINQIVTDRLLDGLSVGLFPEGKTGDGNTVLPFKAPLLEAAIMAKSKITPLIIEYTDKNHRRTNQVTYAGKISLYQSVINTLLLNRIHVKIYSSPEIDAKNFESRDELSAYLYTQISQVYHKK